MRDMNYHYSNIKWCLHPQGVVVWLRVEAPIPVPFYSDFTRYLYSYPFMGISFSYLSTDRVSVKKIPTFTTHQINKNIFVNNTKGIYNGRRLSRRLWMKK
jgi:hypothetical protein